MNVQPSRFYPDGMMEPQLSVILYRRMMLTAGFREREHTADWELEAWAPDFPSLLEQAARGMYTLMGTHMETGPRRARDLALPCADLETCLVAFLSELLFINETEGLAFDAYSFQMDGLVLHAHLEGAAIVSQTKEIKAVTYHNLSIRQTERGMEVSIVFDV